MTAPAVDAAREILVIGRGGMRRGRVYTKHRRKFFEGIVLVNEPAGNYDLSGSAKIVVGRIGKARWK